MPDRDISTQRIDALKGDAARMQHTQAAQRLAQYAIAQESAAEEFQEWGDLNAFNPLAMARRFETLDTRVKRRGREEEADKTEKKEDGEILLVESLQETAEDFHKRNPELQARTLLLLRSRITDQDSKEEILRKVHDFYTDASLADEALEFLAETTKGEVKKNVLEVKGDQGRLYDREIKAGRNIGIQAREFAAQGLGSANALRDLYRDITGNPREAHALFQELATNFPYEKMKTVIDFLLHSLGSDLKSKGPSISHGELLRLLTDTRTLQAILGVYRFFKSRMRLIFSSFERQGLALSSRINFEILAKLFMKFIQERYPSVEKALQLSQQMGISDEVLAQIILYVQFRDAMRQVAPKLFRNEQHRQEMLMCFIETLEELDEELEEEEKEEEKEK